MKETTSTKCKIYRINPSCPNCGEEHAYYDIMLSEEEQNTLDNYYANHQGESSLVLLLKEPPLRIEKNFCVLYVKWSFLKVWEFIEKMPLTIKLMIVFQKDICHYFRKYLFVVYAY